VGSIGPVANDDGWVQLRRQNLTWREIDGVIVVLDLDSSTYLTTNQSGRFLWEMMIDGTTVTDLVARLQSSFALSDETAATDVESFLQLLDANNLLQRAE
jgi:hypothetical protein